MTRHRHPWLRPGLSYFLLVFAAGFILGTLRELFIKHHIGSRASELGEMPIMLLVIWFSAKAVTTRFAALREPGAALLTGLAALAMLLTMEVVLVIFLRQMTISDYISSRDSFAGAAYLASLIFYTLLPCWLSLRSKNLPHL